MKTRSPEFSGPLRLVDPDLFARYCAGILLDEDTGCLEWQASTAKGYGSIGWRGQLWRVPRIAWMLFNGPIPDDLWVLHKNTCHNRACANTEHLYLGTASDNNYDIARLGMNRLQTNPVRGEQCSYAKLTAAQVLTIRARYQTGSISRRCLAREYGMSSGAIDGIVDGRKWKHLLPTGQERGPA